MDYHDVIEAAANFARELEFTDIQVSEDHCVITLDPYSSVRLHLYIDDEEKLEFYFYIRTNSYMYNGERTDLHDIISVTLAAFSKISE